tara:strand:- start:829 stop:1446 length:618 start_codon:yes stop_codon:yes gene_type:complete
MALPASGQIDFGQIQTEFGGSNPIAMNEYSDRLGLGYVLNYTGSHNIGMFYGLSNISLGSWPAGTLGWYELTAFKSDQYEAFLRLNFSISGSNVVLGWTKGGSSAIATEVTQNLPFTGENPQVKVVWSINAQTGTRSSPSLTSNTYYSIPTSGARQYLWKAGFATSGINTISGSYTVYINNSAGTVNSGSRNFSLSTTAGGFNPK